jgi:predicted membrane GTPase involved in stress response
MLFVAGAVTRLGRVDEGTTTTDFDDEEIERKISLQTALAHLEWKGKKVNLLDTPGYAAFVADAKGRLAVADAALLLVEGVAGVQVITERVFKFAQEVGRPPHLRDQQARPRARLLRAGDGVDPGPLRPAAPSPCRSPSVSSRASAAWWTC